MRAEDLFSLDRVEFEQLCADLLRAEGYTNLIQLNDHEDTGIDIICDNNGKKVAVEVLHTKIPLSVKNLVDSVHKIERSIHNPEEVILMTSSILVRLLDVDLSDFGNLRIIDQDRLISLLEKHSSAENERITAAKKRSLKQLATLTYATLVMIASIASLVSLSLNSFVNESRPDLKSRIKTVESALDNIKDLEEHLSQIKSDMLTVEADSSRIEKEYYRALELEKITDKQLASMKNALRYRSWKEVIAEYLLAFILGVASSISASVMYSKYKKRKALNQPV